MANHGERGHAAWSASASARNFACPGSFRLTANLPPQPESLPAAWGTACHQLSERCLENGKDAAEYIGSTEKTKEHEIDVDEELAETAQVYIEYVRELGERAEWLKIEQFYSLDKIKPPFEAGGTADATAWLPDEETLEVVDLKGGRGVFVNAVENKQARTYALGALLAHPGTPCKKIRVTIVQPRIPHKSGTIRSEEFHVADLMDWTADLLDAMAAAAAPDAPLVPGDHCGSTFCAAQGFCPALRKKSEEAVGLFFDDLDQPQISNQPDTLMPEDIAKVLDSADMVQNWLNAVRAYAHAQAESGVAIPGYVLVDKQARKKWTADEKIIAEAARKAGLDDTAIYNAPKIMTPTQVLKALGKKNQAAIEGMYAAQSSGTNLVRSDKTSRAPVPPAVDRHFDILE